MSTSRSKEQEEQVLVCRLFSFIHLYSLQFPAQGMVPPMVKMCLSTTTKVIRIAPTDSPEAYLGGVCSFC